MGRPSTVTLGPKCTRCISWSVESQFQQSVLVSLQSHTNTEKNEGWKLRGAVATLNYFFCFCFFFFPTNIAEAYSASTNKVSSWRQNRLFTCAQRFPIWINSDRHLYESPVRQRFKSCFARWAFRLSARLAKWWPSSLYLNTPTAFYSR